ncbi:MAG: hypothetical protein KIT80_12445 [Chitinophagaceae bacterium]|nr:hypothetical protein [Chitinophagaceae bacterium]MCW5927713.1 hypothetical protein [Chitinophagaceae bacterium]
MKNYFAGELAAIFTVLIVSSLPTYAQIDVKSPAPNKIDTNGLMQEFWKMGEPYIGGNGWNNMVMAEGFYYNSKKIGVWKKTTHYGKLVDMEIYYDTLENDVERIVYYENGKVEAKGKISLRPFPDTITVDDSVNVPKTVYLANRLMKHGFWQFYDINEKLTREGEFFDDKQVGVWRYYNKDGTISEKEF